MKELPQSIAEFPQKSRTKIAMNFSEKHLTVIPIPNEKNTICLGRHLASILRLGDCLTLSGDLGSGKSFLARSIIRFLMHDDALEVLSPTFTLVQLYDASIPVAPFDFYRLSSPQEEVALGFDEILNERICIIEWPEIVRSLLPKKYIDILLSQGKTGRKATISAVRCIISHINQINRSTSQQ